MCRPAARTSRPASRSPARTSATTSALVAAFARAFAMAGPLATASRQPVLPQRHGRSSPPGTAMWPRSPAAPWAPRRIWPSEMIPAPMPVATLTNSRWSTSGHSDVCSPRAMTLTSLSTSTGTRSLRDSSPGTSASSQPGMIGGLIGRPVECSTGPGRPTPTLTRSLSGRPAVLSSSRPSSTTRSSTGPGPSAIATGSWCSARTVPTRSVRARREWVAPRSTARMTRAAGLNANVAGGRPPVELASPAGVTNPEDSRRSTRAAIVERACPVRVARSERVRG